MSIKNKPFATSSSLPKSMLHSQTSLYCASILDPNSSLEDSVLQKTNRNNDSVRSNETESEVSEEEISMQEKDEEMTAVDSGVVKDSSDEPRAASAKDEELEEGELRDDEEEVKVNNGFYFMKFKNKLSSIYFIS